MKKVDIIRIEKDQRKPMQDMITSEITIRMEINSETKILLPCSGRNIKELITGYLFTNGLIDTLVDIRSLDYDLQSHTATISINPEKKMLNGFRWNADLRLPAQRVIDLVDEFSNLSDRFRKTGGVHTAAVATKKGIIKHFDDISRHNTLDTIIGWSMLNNEPFEDKCLLVTSRIPRKIIEKAVRAGFPMMVSVSPPTDQALAIARDNRIALAGFVRGERMNIYNREECFT